MRVLFVSPYVPNLIRVRPYNLIRHLAARGHQVSLVTPWTTESERRDLAEIGRCCAEVRTRRLPAWRSLANCVGALFTGEPLQVRYSWSKALHRDVVELRREADVVHVEHLRGARYAVASTAGVASPTPVVWDSVDCITDLFEQALRGRRDRMGRLINRLELSRTRRYEGWLVSQFDRVLVTSPVDKASLLSLSRVRRDGSDRAAAAVEDDRVSVLSNGVDLEYFTPGHVARDDDRLVFSGKMSYHANESAVLHLFDQVMPRVWARRPSARLVVVGKDPSRRLTETLARDARVTVEGTVPDIRPYLRRASLAVVPLVYGVGCQNKVLEAMACGTPVVATPRAVVALEAQAGRDVMVAEHPEAFADAVIGLLGSPRRREAIGHAGRSYVEAHHSWRRVAAQLEAIYREVASRRRGTQPLLERTGTDAAGARPVSPSAPSSPLVH